MASLTPYNVSLEFAPKVYTAKEREVETWEGIRPFGVVFLTIHNDPLEAAGSSDTFPGLNPQRKMAFYTT